MSNPVEPSSAAADGEGGASTGVSTENLAELAVQTPPTTLVGILSRIGPGLIIAAAIVGSGELIATTKVGAEAGYGLLWLILFGCVIKSFLQIEFGRFSIVQGKTSLDGLNELPGPRLGANWLAWCWLAMFIAAVAQLGGIVGGVGQALSLSFPLTGDYQQFVDGAAIDYTWDDVIWSAILTVVTAALLVNGRYGVVQSVSTVLVAAFTLITVFSFFGLQSDERWHTGWSDLQRGLSLGLPGATPEERRAALGTALAAFGIIGVGASELVAYPYWCLEKGYARWTGPRNDSPEWAARAAGWLRVMKWDAFCSMCVFTAATAAFYLLGAAVLHRQGLNPENDQMIPTLEKMYTDNDFFLGFGRQFFLFGAFAVLYSTFFVSTAGNSRMAADAVRVFTGAPRDEKKQLARVRFFSGAFPFVSLVVFVLSKSPVTLVMISGFAQASLLPLLGVAGLFFRYRRCDVRIAPGRLWDFFLWLSVAALVVTGTSGAWNRITQFYDRFFGG